MKKVSVLLSLILTIVCAFCFVACGSLTSGAKTEEKKETTTKTQEQGKKYETIEEAKEDVLSPVTFPQAEVASNADDGFLFGYFGYVYYGQYPQTVAEKKALKEMSQTTDSTGYFVSSYDNEHYARIATANVYGDKYEFSDEKDIVARETYYFKVEPIKWRVFGRIDLASGDRSLYLVSDLILDSSAFIDATKFSMDPGEGVYYTKGETVHPTAWAYSDLRKFMNEDFYNKAFTESEKAKIESNEVEVPEGATVSNTDKVFALSYLRAKSLSEEYQRAIVSDYARCRGTFMSVYSDTYGNGRWWLSTESESGNARENSYRVTYISNFTPKGEAENILAANALELKGESVAATYMGVRPAMVITVDSAFEILTEEEEDKK